MTPLSIEGGRHLLPGGLAETTLHLHDGRIAAHAAPGARRLDARGLLVLPGIVDLHGDAHERQLQPRPGVGFPAPLALADTEAQLLASGVTTAFLAVTLSWEPGLRGAESWTALRAALSSRTPVGCDLRVHLRWEAFNLDALDMALEAIAADAVHLLAFNDHTPSILRKLDQPAALAKFVERAGVPADAFRALASRAASRGAEVLPARARAGDRVVMGAPNVLRGGSHMGWGSAASMVAAGHCDVLVSDYFYPALLHAPFRLVAEGVCDLPAAWALVSANPAAAGGLPDRGTLEPGRRADVVLVAPPASGAPARVVAVVAGGRLAHLAGEGAERLG